MDDDYSAEGDLESNTEEHSVADSGSLAVVKNEIKMMNIVRTFVYALILSVATITAEVVYVVIRMNQENAYEENFDMYASLIIAGFYDKLNSRLIAASSLSTSLTLQATDMKSTWPYVSFPEFEMRCSGTRQMAGASSVTLSPLIPSNDSETHQNWETYATYTNLSGSLESDYADDFQVSDTDEQTVYYMDRERLIEQGIYYVESGEARDLPAAPRNNATSIVPLWQRSPTPSNGTEIRMYDQMSNPIRSQTLNSLLEAKQNAIGVFTDFLIYDSNLTDYAYYTTPRSALYSPVYESADDGLVVATLDLEFLWETFLEGLLEDNVESLVVVAQSSCSDREYSFAVHGSVATYLGPGDLSEPPSGFDPPEPINSTYEAFLQIIAPSSNATSDASLLPCQFRIRVYVTQDFKDVYMTALPAIYRWIILGVFMVVVCVFLIYDCVVERRANKVVDSAKQTDALVSSLFPSSVKQRLLENAEKKRQQQMEAKLASRWQANHLSSFSEGNVTDDSEMRLPMIHTPKRRLKSFLHPGEGQLLGNHDIDDSEPIADLFPNASVMFADVAGFTAWSSERDPSQVFKLLETLYRAMDKAARRFRVFKVETIGDCYVAASGLPDQRDDHVEAITRFARTCLMRTNQLTKTLDATLGPGTSELALRFGIHSGPVTAGVLRGEKARFQLFGDTMNFAARMESTGERNKIQLSHATAAILIKRGKSHWVAQREERVYAKGKGELITYWLQIGQSGSSATSGSCSGASSAASNDLFANEYQNNKLAHAAGAMTNGIAESVLKGVIGETKLSKHLDRLVEWNTGTLGELLKKVVASRGDKGTITAHHLNHHGRCGASRSFLDEMDLIIPLPPFDAEAVARVHEVNVELPKRVTSQLRMYVAAIASGYRNNAFHNFEHASHVILSATKLLKRISYADGHASEDGITTADLHDYTYGISSDPLTQFAVVFAALIHDVGHEGVPNGQLATECPHIAEVYDHKSVAEQRSVDVALELLMLPKYRMLMEYICGDENGLERFRKLLIHCVLATDIFEKDLKEKRNQRWEQAFHSKATDENPVTEDGINCKATIVLEHIIQASDVSHTMQHWHIYIKWNERLFQEMYAAYKDGRSEKDPSEGWYKGELWFYDNYVIPLAMKLKECGVFGVSSDEYLTYAVQNRTEWEKRGMEICKAMKERCDLAGGKKRKKEAVPEGDDQIYSNTLHREYPELVNDDGHNYGEQ